MGSAEASLVIRDAVGADIAAIQSIYAFHVLNGTASFEESPPSPEEIALRKEAVTALDLPYLVAQCEGHVAGFAYASPYRPRRAYRYALEDSVYVRDELRGRGIGTALLRELLDRCERGPSRQMLAVIGDSGNAGSVQLHARLGFRHVGTFTAVGFKFGRWLDTVLMQRPLGEGDGSLPV